MIVEKNTITVSCELDLVRNAKLDQIKSETGLNKCDIVLQALIEYIDNLTVNYESSWNKFASEFTSMDKFAEPLIKSLKFVSFNVAANTLTVSLPFKYKDLVEYAQSVFVRKCVNDSINTMFGSRPMVIVQHDVEQTEQQCLI